MTQADWPSRLTRVLAGEVRRYRILRKLSAQGLADRCAELGMPIRRSVLANLESGRRDTLSVAELLILARALDVPPVVLIFPLGRADKIEIAPGQQSDTWAALQWFTGEGGEADGGQEVVDLFRRHARMAETYPALWRTLRDAMASSGEPDDGESGPSRLYEDAVKVGREEVRQLRSLMRERGLIPPELPPELAGLEGTELR